MVVDGDDQILGEGNVLEFRMTSLCLDFSEAEGGQDPFDFSVSK